MSKETSAKDKEMAKSIEGALLRQTRAASVFTDVIGPRAPQSRPDTPTVVELSAAPLTQPLIQPLVLPNLHLLFRHLQPSLLQPQLLLLVRGSRFSGFSRSSSQTFRSF